MEEDQRREAAIASAACLNPNFRPSSSVSQARISKLEELHKRRLQIKEKSKIKTKPKGKSSGSTRLQVKDHIEAGASDIQCKTGSSSVSLDENATDMPKTMAAQVAPTKPQKLYWGLDTKERWERKSNM